MKRVLEPELMEDEAQGLAYAQADFSGPNQQFLDLFARRFPDFPPDGKREVSVVDLGCGPADILLRFARRYPGVRCLGIDGAPAMLRPGIEAVARAGLENRIRLLVRRLPCSDLPGKPFAAILSNSLLHHLHRPEVLWDALPGLGAGDCCVLVMDLMRPASRTEAARIVSTYAGSEPPILQEDFFHSLLAAFEPQEVRQQLQRAGLDLACDQVSDRHLAVWGRLPSGTQGG